MKTVQLTGIRQMALREIPQPRIERDDDVLVRVRAVGVCGSDVHYYASGGIGTQRVEYPFTVGHEGAGTVEAVGAGVIGIGPGDRVAVDPAISCGKCDQCLAQRPNTCRELRFISCPGEAPGCLSEYVVMPERNCHPVGAGISLEHASFSEPLSIGIYAVRQSVPMANATVLIQGAGPIGLSVLTAAKLEQPRRVLVTDKIETRLDVARRAGADWTGNPDERDTATAMDEVGPLGSDVVFECCGDQEALDEAVRVLKPGGKLMILGIPEERRLSFDFDLFRRKELTFYYVRRQSECVQPALDLMAARRVDVGAFITHHFPLEETQRAFDLVDTHADGVVKAMIVPA